MGELFVLKSFDKCLCRARIAARGDHWARKIVRLEWQGPPLSSKQMVHEGHEVKRWRKRRIEGSDVRERVGGSESQRIRESENQRVGESESRRVEKPGVR